MKHLFAAFLSLLALLALAAPACADAWQDPPSDRFFESHRGQCTYENRRYYANGKEGFITLWDAPGGSEVRAQYENGEVLWTSCTYRSWALVSRREDRTGTAGWVKLADLYRRYDHISFQEKYGDQFREYGGELGTTPSGRGRCISYCGNTPTTPGPGSGWRCVRRFWTPSGARRARPAVFPKFTLIGTAGAGVL